MKPYKITYRTPKGIGRLLLGAESLEDAREKAVKHLDNEEAVITSVDLMEGK